MSFQKQIAKFNKLATDRAEQTLRATALDMFGKIAIRTPVKTGRLRGNWQSSINTSNGVVGSGEIKKAKLGQSIFITNNLPYAIAIENGHGANNPPGGMVKVTVLEFQAAVRRNIKR